MNARAGRIWSILAAATWAVGDPGWVEAQRATDIEPGPKGVVIEEVGEGSALEKAGLRPGDVVWAWERLPNPPANPEAERGEIESVFDWMWLEVEQVPRGTVKVFGEREVKNERGDAASAPFYWAAFQVIGDWQ